MAWWHRAFDAWSERAGTHYRAILGAEARFPDAPVLLSSFAHTTDVWHRRRDAASARALQEKANELAVAGALLGLLGQSQLLAYEPTLSGTKKTIDFLIAAPGVPSCWIDVKTVAPEWRDTQAAWKRFERVRDKAPRDVMFIRRRKWGGAGIANQELNVRLAFVRKTVELETKIATLEGPERVPVTMLFCTCGSAWSADSLEDFADFYRTGRFRSDDPLSNATTKYMTENGLVFNRTVEGFHYLERKQFEPASVEFRTFINGAKAVF